MTDYFVDPASGDDINDGTDPDAPFASVARGLAALGSGDVLNLHAGSTYGPTMVFAAGLPDGIVVQPYAGDRVLVDGRVRFPDLGVVPNEGWERVVDGHLDEWRTRDTFEVPISGNRDLARVRYGSFTGSRLRLITYARLDDLRAANESFVTVPLSDPRPAAGPLFFDRAHKRPWTYLGPGLTWVFEEPDDPTNRRGRVHVRLSPTHLRSPATRDYNGPSDPNQVGLALSAEGRVTVAVGASNFQLRGFVIANGGTTTLHVTDAARDVTFDHCDVFGGRFGVRVSGNAARIAFRHCTFDGALAPWTVRSDIKSEYDFVDTDGNTAHNGMGAETHDMLVITHAADNVEFDHCAFRRAHDAVQLGGDDVSIHHCLFEDINDEVVQFHRTSNARVFKNLMRQVLHPFSFALEQHGGPVFIYRNVIDQRLPTRGHRTLPPDAPAAHVSRYGASYKTGFPMPATYVYQNTFVGADRDDKGSALSVLFARSDLSPTSARIHLNNIVVGLDVDEPLMWAAAPSLVRRSDGNLWYSPQRSDAPLALRDLPGGAIERIRTVERLHELGWELTSRFIEPGLRNFDDEIFQHGRYLGDEQPNNDWRPAPGSPAIGAGIDLPDDLPDPDRPPFGLRPDIGAMKATAPPLRVGVDDEVVLPAPQRPIARAGADQLIVDSDGDGFANVTLDGSASTPTTGVLTGHTWSVDEVEIASGRIATVQLAEGDHLVRLEVRNSVGHTDTDSTRVAIRPVRPHGPNLVAAGGFEERVPWRLRDATIVEGPVHSGHRALRMEPSRAATAAQRIAVNPGTRYRLSAWIRRMPLVARPLRVQATHLDADGATIAVEPFTFTGATSYTYREAVVVTPETAVTMELVLRADPMPGAVFVDDFRLIDDSLVINGGFETRPANGRADESPGWRFEAGGARVVTDEVRSGRRAVAIEGLDTDFRQVTQDIGDLAGASRLRVTGWLRTEGVSEAPTITARFNVEGNLIIAEQTSEDEWSLIGRTIDVPAGAQQLTLHVRVERGTTGTTYVDDVLVVPVSANDRAATNSLVLATDRSAAADSRAPGRNVKTLR